MVNEGGSVEIDGNGVLMACKSSILNNNRNPGMTQQQAEDIFTKNLGVTKFIWLEGKAGLDITDMHIDGFARFANSSTIITMNSNDLAYWQVPDNDINNLYNATGKNGAAYQFVKVPLTKHEVTTTYGKKVGRASYINYYIANNRVLVLIIMIPMMQLQITSSSNCTRTKRLLESTAETCLPMVAWYIVLHSSNPDKIM